MDEMLKPQYVWTMAAGKYRADQSQLWTQPNASARSRMRNAEEKIDQLVLERAEAIKHEHVHGKIESGDF